MRPEKRRFCWNLEISAQFCSNIDTEVQTGRGERDGKTVRMPQQLQCTHSGTPLGHSIFLTCGVAGPKWSSMYSRVQQTPSYLLQGLFVSPQWRRGSMSYLDQHQDTHNHDYPTRDQTLALQAREREKPHLVIKVHSFRVASW